MRRGVQVAVTLGLLVLLWHLADGRAAVARLSAADPVWLLAALAALSLQTVLSALRWRLTAGQLGLHLGAGLALREYYLGQVVNQVLPGGVLGDAARALRTRAAAGLMAAAQAVVFERLAGQIALLAVLVLGLVGATLVPGGMQVPLWVTGPVAGMIAASLGAALILALLPPRAAPFLRGQIRAFFHAVAAPSVRFRQAALSIGTVLCNIAGFACAAQAVGVALSLTQAMVLVPLILLAMVIPISISGWGLREGAAAALLPLAGFAPSDGLAASIAFGLVFLGAVLPGVLWAGVLWAGVSGNRPGARPKADQIIGTGPEDARESAP